MLNLYICSPIWLERSRGPESVDMGVSFRTSPFSVYATLTALQFERSGEPPLTHSLVVSSYPQVAHKSYSMVLTVCGVGWFVCGDEFLF